MTASTDFFREHGWVHVPAVFTPAETAELAADLDWIGREWATRTPLPGPWRDGYAEAGNEGRSYLEVSANLHHYSSAWQRAVAHPRMVSLMRELLGSPDVEFHFSAMHTKPPGTGDMFPMHQDHPFFPHADGRYVEALVHLDDTCHANGEIRFLDGSHKAGPLEHVTEGFLHLPPDRYRLSDTVAVPARAGDVICFTLCTVHGSYPNTTDRPRRMVRMNYRHPQNLHMGQIFVSPGTVVSGRRGRLDGQEPFPQQ